jgi:hypothetical protein
MDMVFIGGVGDGHRRDYGANPPKYTQVAEYEPPMYKYWETSLDTMEKIKSYCSEYRLEHLRTAKVEIAFYVATDISIEEALLLLVSNYAIGDPTKHR